MLPGLSDLVVLGFLGCVLECVALMGICRLILSYSFVVLWVGFKVCVVHLRLLGVVIRVVVGL